MQLLPLGGFLHMGGLLEAQGLIHELRNVVGVLVDREAAALLCKLVAGDVTFLGQGAVDHDRPADLLDGQDLLLRGMDTVDREVVNVPGLRAGLAGHALLRALVDMLPQLEKLNAALKEIAARHSVAPAQVPVAWAIAKGTLPIIGVTQVSQVEDAAKAASLTLSADEIARLEELGGQAGVNVIRYWEKEMK